MKGICKICRKEFDSDNEQVWEIVDTGGKYPSVYVHANCDDIFQCNDLIGVWEEKLLPDDFYHFAEPLW